MTLLSDLEAAEAGSRFWSKVDKNGRNGCWLWTASKTTKGYGQFSLGSRKNGTYFMAKAHRVAYELLVAPIGGSLTIDHICRVRHCVNPDHLEPVTNRENILRGTSPSAVFARRTHCIRGHLLSGDNLYIPPAGWRLCRTCRREGWRERRARRVACLRAMEQE